MRTYRPSLGVLAILAALTPASPAPAQQWPAKPVKIIVPFAAGGNGDIITRLIAPSLGEALGQQFVVENRPGAGGTFAAEAVARSPADGYTLFMANVPVIAIAPAAGKTSYDPVKDFSPISVIGTNPLAFVVHPSLPVTTMAEFIDHVRKHPGKLTYAASGAGTLIHLSTALFLKRAGIEMIPVNYRGGGAPPLTDVIAGHVNAYLANLAVVLPHARSGALRPLAVTSERRVAQMPDVPTFMESGFPGFKVLTWNGLMAPAGTPRDITERIAREVARTVKDPHLTEKLAGIGVEPLGNTPDEFAAMVAADIALWKEAVRIAGEPEK
jgi:tripartite-type tricarboxylate transporter receptor subunit TctC